MTKPKSKPDFDITDHLVMASAAAVQAHNFWLKSQLAVTIVAVESALANLNAAREQLRQYEEDRP